MTAIPTPPDMATATATATEVAMTTPLSPTTPSKSALAAARDLTNTVLMIDAFEEVKLQALAKERDSATIKLESATLTEEEQHELARIRQVTAIQGNIDNLNKVSDKIDCLIGFLMGDGEVIDEDEQPEQMDPEGENIQKKEGDKLVAGETKKGRRG